MNVELVKNQYVRYKTKPLESWKKAKEIRDKAYREISEARQKGKMVITGGTEAFIALPAGLGDYVYLGGEPYGATVGSDPAFSQLATEAWEARGFSRDMCSYVRNYLGSMFMNRYYFGGEFPIPDFTIQMHLCDSHAKWYQIASEHYGVPYFCVDLPPDMMREGIGLRRKYIVEQLLEAIEWMEKTFHKKYDDEKLIEATINEYHSSALWGEICLLNRAVPAPLDIKTLFSFYVICVLIRHKKESVDFYTELRAELQDRIENGIAALATERCRILDDSQPMWPFLNWYRHMEKYGAVTVGSLYAFGLSGNYDEQPDGTWVLKKSLEERNKIPKTREDALNILVEFYLERPINRTVFLPHLKSPMIIMLTKEFKCQGVTIHLNRGCEMITAGVMEVRLALQKAGIPVMTYEGNMADKREIDERQTLDRVDSFMESMGLQKISE